MKSHGRLGFFVRRMKADEISDYFNIRQMLERYAAHLILANISGEEIKALENNVAESETYFSGDNFKKFVLCNSQFHELLIKTAHSAVLHSSIASLDDISIFLRSMDTKNEAGMLNSIEGHKKIIAAVKENNIDQLRQTLLEHHDGLKQRNMAFIEFIT